MNKKEKMNYLIRGYIGVEMEYKEIEAIQKVARLAKKHRLICEWACNGYKWNNENFIYDQVEYEKDIAKIENKITLLIGKPLYAIEFQHDPRGWTVKLYHTQAGSKYAVIPFLKDISELLYL